MDFETAKGFVELGAWGFIASLLWYFVTKDGPRKEAAYREDLKYAWAQVALLAAAIERNTLEVAKGISHEHQD